MLRILEVRYCLIFLIRINHLIDEAGLKGYSIGDAEISEKHAGFIVNVGNATAKDVLDLIKYVKEKVYEKFKIEIKEEIRILGEI